MTTPRTACGVTRIIANDFDPSGQVSDGVGTLTLNNGAWYVTDWMPIRRHATRGTALTVPGLDYSIPMPTYRDTIEVSLKMVFGGDVDHLGASRAPLDVMQGLETNIAAFEDFVVQPATTDNLLDLTLTLVTGTTITGDLQTKDLEFSNAIQGYARAVWRVSFSRT